MRSLESLSGVKGVSDAFKNEDQQGQHHGEDCKGRKGQPRGLKVLFGLQSQFAK
jgi:hypothetical protein